MKNLVNEPIEQEIIEFIYMIHYFLYESQSNLWKSFILSSLLVLLARLKLLFILAGLLNRKIRSSGEVPAIRSTSLSTLPHSFFEVL